MEALIPNKDSLFELIQLQKKILQRIQKKNPEAVISPLFPLYAFSEKIERDILSVKIEKIDFCTKDNVFSFSTKIEHEDCSQILKIDFGKTVSGKINESSISEIDFFEMNLKIFRLATVIFENNTWQVLDEKWIKLKKSV